ncbi:MAG: glucose-6-phosphate isomerase [Clostridiales bacterium]|nr:glucose-6-phosphate isomerase [Clostridiales bacterium]
MGDLTFDYSMADAFVSEQELENLQTKVDLAHELLESGQGPGSEYAGWLNWPETYDRAEFARVKEVAATIREKADVFVVIGIGGSYLGARSALSLLTHAFSNQLPRDKRGGPEIYFAGQNVSPDYLTQLLDIVGDRELYINVVSKSGTTLEPALAFRVFRRLLEERYGREGAGRRIIATTDREKGALKKLADEEGYETFVVPDEVGGRYSVLTPVGLLPIAVGGIDLDAVMAGAADAQRLYKVKELGNNPAYRYAAVRNLLYNKGKTVELLATYEPSFSYFTEWWKQLFGESEGKENKGIFPAGVNFTTDLHSLGQYIQDGYRHLFTTTVWVDKPAADMTIIDEEGNPDGLNYLTGKSLHEVNLRAREGTMLAHTEGSVPNLLISVPEISPYWYGRMVYYFEKACGISGYLLGVNPFDQPGVEAYKKNMFRLLGKM